jgi:cell wall-associated NlpC family hydrolase
MISRAELINKAREYVGTPFRHQGRSKGPSGYLDCVGLILCAAEELNLLDVNGKPLLGSDYMNYGAQPHKPIVHEICLQRLVHKPAQAMLPGDVVSIRNPTVACHAAIIATLGSQISMIHVYSTLRRNGPHSREAGITAETLLSSGWRSHIEGVFSIPGVE